MFEFKPAVSSEAIRQHVNHSKEVRRTFLFGGDMHCALVHEKFHPGKTSFSTLFREETTLISEAQRIWFPFEADVAQCVRLIKDCVDFSDKIKDHLIEVLEVGVLGCQINNPVFRLEKMAGITEELTFLKQSENPMVVQIVRAMEYALEVAPMYSWTFCNTEDQFTNVMIDDRYVFPENGLLYSYCVAFLPMSERALQLANWFLTAREAVDSGHSDMWIPFGMGAFFTDDEGKIFTKEYIHKQ